MSGTLGRIPMASDAFSLYDGSDSDSDQWEDEQVDDEKEEQIAFEKQS